METSWTGWSTGRSVYPLAGWKFGRLVGLSVGRSVGWSVGWIVWLVMHSSKSLKNGLLWILNDSDSAGREKKRDEEEGLTRRVKKNEKLLKNEKVAKGRIVGLAGPCSSHADFSLYT